MGLRLLCGVGYVMMMTVMTDVNAWSGRFKRLIAGEYRFVDKLSYVTIAQINRTQFG
jgi:hypothetical protein